MLAGISLKSIQKTHHCHECQKQGHKEGFALCQCTQ